MKNLMGEAWKAPGYSQHQLDTIPPGEKGKYKAELARAAKLVLTRNLAELEKLKNVSRLIFIHQAADAAYKGDWGDANHAIVQGTKVMASVGESRDRGGEPLAEDATVVPHYAKQSLDKLVDIYGFLHKAKLEFDKMEEVPKDIAPVYDWIMKALGAHHTMHKALEDLYSHARHHLKKYY